MLDPHNKARSVGPRPLPACSGTPISPCASLSAVLTYIAELLAAGGNAIHAALVVWGSANSTLVLRGAFLVLRMNPTAGSKAAAVAMW